jgi:hypothetical protein
MTLIGDNLPKNMLQSAAIIGKIFFEAVCFLNLPASIKKVLGVLLISKLSLYIGNICWWIGPIFPFLYIIPHYGIELLIISGYLTIQGSLEMKWFLENLQNLFQHSHRKIAVDWIENKRVEVERILKKYELIEIEEAFGETSSFLKEELISNDDPSKLPNCPITHSPVYFPFFMPHGNHHPSRYRFAGLVDFKQCPECRGDFAEDAELTLDVNKAENNKHLLIQAMRENAAG